MGGQSRALGSCLNRWLLLLSQSLPYQQGDDQASVHYKSMSPDTLSQHLLQWFMAMAASSGLPWDFLHAAQGDYSLCAMCCPECWGFRDRESPGPAGNGSWGRTTQYGKGHTVYSQNAGDAQKDTKKPTGENLERCPEKGTVRGNWEECAPAEPFAIIRRDF